MPLSRICNRPHGALARASNKVPIRNVIDAWGERLVPSFRRVVESAPRCTQEGGTAGMGQQQDTLYESFVEARAKSHHIVAKVGDHLPITVWTLLLLPAAAKF